MRKIAKAVNLARILLPLYLSEGMTVVDATAGNGNDSMFLKEHIGAKGHLYCFDIQASAIQATKKRLNQAGLEENTTFVLDGHEHLQKHVRSSVDLVMYNLGYLPRHDKTKKTLPETTLESVRQAMEIIVPGGAISIIAYPGHEEGAQEKDALDAFLSKVDQTKFDVLKGAFINQVNNPPIWYLIEKREA